MAKKRRPRPIKPLPKKTPGPEAPKEPEAHLTLKFLPIEKLNVDSDYQRAENRPLGTRLDAAFDWARFGAATITKDADNQYHVVDGKQRIAAARRFGATRVPCVISNHPDTQVQAADFLGINTDRVQVSSVDRFKASVVSRDPLSLKINALIERSGYRLAAGGGTKTLQCVSALVVAFKRDYLVAANVLTFCLNNLYAGMPVASVVYRGLFELELFLHREHSRTICKGAIAKKLVKLGPLGVKDAAMEAGAYFGRNGPIAWRFGIARAINKGARTNRIPLPAGPAD